MSKDLEALITEAHEALQFGTVHLTLKKAAGNITTVDLTKITRRKVTGSSEALTVIGTMLKLLKESGDTGELTFTISLDKGDSSQILMHDFRRSNLSAGSYQ